MKNLLIKDIKNFNITEHCLLINSSQKGSLLLDWNKISVNNLKIVVENNVQLEVLELNDKEDSVIDFVINDDSSVLYNIFSSKEAFSSTRNFYLNKNARLDVAVADFSNGKKTFNAKVDLLNVHSEVYWHLACLSKDDDNKTFLVNFNHEVGETVAKMENYGVCKDSSTLNFLGDAVIKQGAKKSKTNQSAKIMVFDKTCHAKASLKLCIYENDVEASHGASEGQINPEHVFYLTSRGIEEELAKRLITLGYLYPIMKFFPNEELRKEIEECIVNKV